MFVLVGGAENGTVFRHRVPWASANTFARLCMQPSDSFATCSRFAAAECKCTVINQLPQTVGVVKRFLLVRYFRSVVVLMRDDNFRRLEMECRQPTARNFAYKMCRWKQHRALSIHSVHTI